MSIFVRRTSSQRRSPPFLSVARHLFSSSTAATTTISSIPASSNLYDKYPFKPLLSLRQNPNHKSPTDNKTTKKQKLPYRPPSSLDRAGANPLRSDLPFDFRFSYTESNLAVRPIGLFEPKYQPFGSDSLVPMVRDAFLTNELVRIDCQGLEKSYYKKIGRKLRVKLWLLFNLTL